MQISRLYHGKLSAACRGERAEVFYEERFYDLARSICDTCPVKRTCYEVGRRQDWGVWGGVTRGWLKEDDDDFSN